MRLRSIIAVPAGCKPGDPVHGSEADALLFDLADAGVDLAAARDVADGGIRATKDSGKIPLVRVNHPRTQLLRDDLHRIVPLQPAAVVVPHCVNPQDIRDTAVMLREIELQDGVEPGTIAVFAVIDTARGLLRAAEIVDAAPRVAGLVFDGDTYARDIGARPEENGPRLAYARGAVVAAARALDRVPLIVSSGLEMRFLAQHGFAGAVIREARMATSANAVFTPTEWARKRAEDHRDAYEAARANGSWVARVGSEVADAHSARKAAQTLELTD